MIMKSIIQIKDKLKRMRKSGLEKHGEYSVENLAFKVLRRTHFMKMIKQ